MKKKEHFANATYVFSVNTCYFKILYSDRFLFFKKQQKVPREKLYEFLSLQFSFSDLYQSPFSSPLGKKK